MAVDELGDFQVPGDLFGLLKVIERPDVEVEIELDQTDVFPSRGNGKVGERFGGSNLGLEERIGLPTYEILDGGEVPVLGGDVQGRVSQSVGTIECALTVARVVEVLGAVGAQELVQLVHIFRPARGYQLEEAFLAEMLIQNMFRPGL